jgi:tagatose-1,6-bisphosphate aldolase non-catalytic subunit AgaZ/GatZ
VKSPKNIMLKQGLALTVTARGLWSHGQIKLSLLAQQARAPCEGLRMVQKVVASQPSTTMTMRRGAEQLLQLARAHSACARWPFSRPHHMAKSSFFSFRKSSFERMLPSMLLIVSCHDGHNTCSSRMTVC